MKLEDINKSTWFVDRYVKHVPKHFVATHSKVTDENLTWVYERTYGSSWWQIYRRDAG